MPIRNTRHQVIVTKFYAPTNHRGARVRAMCAAGSVRISWDYSLGAEGNHDAAAQALIDKLGWQGRWASGSAPDGGGNVYVCLSRDSTEEG